MTSSSVSVGSTSNVDIRPSGFLTKICMLGAPRRRRVHPLGLDFNLQRHFSIIMVGVLPLPPSLFEFPRHHSHFSVLVVAKFESDLIARLVGACGARFTAQPALCQHCLRPVPRLLEGGERGPQARLGPPAAVGHAPGCTLGACNVCK
jgi:hypothetical protein